MPPDVNPHQAGTRDTWRWRCRCNAVVARVWEAPEGYDLALKGATSREPTVRMRLVDGELVVLGGLGGRIVCSHCGRVTLWGSDRLLYVAATLSRRAPWADVEVEGLVKLAARKERRELVVWTRPTVVT